MEGKADPPSQKNATEVAVRHDDHIASIETLFFVLTMVFTDLQVDGKRWQQETITHSHF